MNLSNYTIKKMIPRLIIAAILVNASFYIAALAVDISNLLGYNLAKLFEAIQVAQGGAGNNAFQAGWETVIGAILAGAGVVALIAVIIMAPTVLLAVAMVAIILVARKALILLLVVIAPIAFVAYLLPNTEDWFKKWYKAFVALLMVFPIISVVFGASTLASKILLGIAADTGGNDTDTQNMLYVVALGVAAIPLFAIPTLLKGSLAAAGSIGTKLSNLSDKSNRYAKNKAMQGRIGEAKTAFSARRQVKRLNRRRGSGWVQTNKDASGIRGAVAGQIAKTGFGKYQKRFDESKWGQRLGGNRGAAAATSGLFKEFDDEVKRQKTLASGRSNEDLLQDLRKGKGSEEYQAAIAGVIMSRDHRASHLEALRIVGQRNTQAEEKGDKKQLQLVSSVQKQMSQDMRNKPWALGDQAAGQLENGVYGRRLDHENKSQTHLGNIDDEIQERIGSKLSAASLSNMNPDEMTVIKEMADRGILSDKQITSLVKAIRESRSNPQMDALVKPQEREKHDAILAKYGDSVPLAGSLSAPETSPQTQAQPPQFAPGASRFEKGDNGLYLPRE